MAKKRFTEDNWQKDPWFNALVNALLSCKSSQEMSDLLRDVGTLSELQAWSERLEVAKQLSRGLSYRQVAENTGASTTTVTRVSRFIENGEGGYRKYLKSQTQHMRDDRNDQVDAEADRPNERQGGIQKASSLRKYLGGT